MLLAMAAGAPCYAQEAGGSQSAITVVATSRPITGLLPGTLGGIRSTSEIKLFQPGSLDEIVGEKAPVFLEYGVSSAAMREYGDYRVEVFQTSNPLHAFGLFTYNSPEPVDLAKIKDSTSAAVRIPEGAMVWESNFFVSINAIHKRPGISPIAARLSADMAAVIGSSKGPAQVPGLLGSLPAGGDGVHKIRYFLGTRALASFVEHAADLFPFEGRAEAVLARYDQKMAGQERTEPLRFLIVEYNTPQFAHDALERATAFAASLPQEDQNSMLIKRTGNYIVTAAGIANHDLAQQLVDSVKYPYTIKWLKDPRARYYDRFAGQKAAQVILSSFGIVGILLMSAFAGGVIFGTVVFVRRRRRQVEVFSDAGGMLCLDLDRLCAAAPVRMKLAGGGLVEGGDN